MAKRYKPCLILAHVQTILNQWCTRRRFGDSNADCPFLCGYPSDCVSHLISCQSFQSIFHPALGQAQVLLPIRALLLFEHNGHPIAEEMHGYMYIYIYVCLKSFNSLRHGSLFSRRSVEHLLVSLAAHCKAARSDIIHFRSNPHLLCNIFNDT